MFEICDQKYEDRYNLQELNVETQPVQSWVCGKHTRLTIWQSTGTQVEGSDDNDPIYKSDTAYSHDSRIFNKHMTGPSDENLPIYQEFTDAYIKSKEDKWYVGRIEVDKLVNKNGEYYDDKMGIFGLTLFDQADCTGNSKGTWYRHTYEQRDWDSWVMKDLRDDVAFESVLVQPHSNFIVYMEDGQEYTFRNELDTTMCFELPSEKPKSYRYDANFTYTSY